MDLPPRMGFGQDWRDFHALDSGLSCLMQLCFRPFQVLIAICQTFTMLIAYVIQP